MKFDAFAMERLQSTWENRVAWNLSESGVHPLRMDEVAESDADRQAALSQPLGYPQTNGTADLRQAIAAMYPGAGIDHVQVTNGGSEANCIALAHLVEPGDDVVVMMPNYMQAPGLVRAFGAHVVPWPLVCGHASGSPRWSPDLDALETLVTDRTRAILICNPNNPTGARFTADQVDAICRTADRSGAWIISDEIYRGAELDGTDTPTVWGRYERAIVTSGLSKAFALPGLRIGWAVAAPVVVEALWGVHDYTSIAPGAINDCLARIALQPARRDRLLARTRGIIRTNYPLVKRWLGHRGGLVSHAAPDAGAIVFVRYRYDINSTELIHRLRDEKGVLAVPGDHFEMDGYFRIGFGSETGYVSSALEAMGELLDTLPHKVADAH